MSTPNTEKPPRLEIVGGWQLTLNLLQSGQQAAIVLGAKHPDGTVMTPSSLGNWRDAAWNAFRTVMHYEVGCTGAVARQTFQDGAIAELGPPSSLYGAMTGQPAVAAGATLIRWSTAQGGRSGRGRTFLPGLTEDGVNNTGRGYETAFANTATSAISAYLGAGFWATSGLEPAVLSFRKGQAYPITSGALSARVGLQRRRMR